MRNEPLVRLKHIKKNKYYNHACFLVEETEVISGVTADVAVSGSYGGRRLGGPAVSLHDNNLYSYHKYPGCNGDTKNRCLVQTINYEKFDRRDLVAGVKQRTTAVSLAEFYSCCT
jgi:hypothetical protein